MCMPLLAAGERSHALTHPRRGLCLLWRLLSPHKCAGGSWAGDRRRQPQQELRPTHGTPSPKQKGLRLSSLQASQPPPPMAVERAPSSRRPRAQGACCVLLLLSLLMLAVLRTASRRLFSMASGAAAESYVPGSLSAAFVTCPNEKVAKELARAVVEKRLAACVNVVPQITSIYEWKGKIQEDAEVLLMIKTRSSRIPALTEFVRSLHPYEVAEVIAVPILQGNPPYLRWVEETVPE